MSESRNVLAVNQSPPGPNPAVTSEESERTTNLTKKSDSRRKLAEELRELIAALDRRVPQIERHGEQDIARDSALLKKKAQERIAQLENEPAAAHRVPRTPLWPKTKSIDHDERG